MLHAPVPDLWRFLRDPHPNHNLLGSCLPPSPQLAVRLGSLLNALSDMGLEEGVAAEGSRDPGKAAQHRQRPGPERWIWAWRVGGLRPDASLHPSRVHSPAEVKEDSAYGSQSVEQETESWAHL